MFIGHFGLSFAAKKAAPKVSLATLFLATQFVDLLWPFLLVFHIEKMAVVPGFTKTNSFDFEYFPWTHSLLMGVVWGIVVGGIYWLIKKDKQGALVVGLCVLSHWFFDLIVHVSDLQLLPFVDMKVGFGLWNHVILTLIIEFVLFLGGAYIYTTVTKAKNWVGKWILLVLVVLLLIVQLGNTYGPPPAGGLVNLLITFLTLFAVILALAWWIDRNRITV